MKNQDEITVMYDAAQMAERREQRRYEIAKQYFDLAMVPNAGRYHPDMAKMEARRAVEYADALLAELERTK